MHTCGVRYICVYTRVNHFYCRIVLLNVDVKKIYIYLFMYIRGWALRTLWNSVISSNKQKWYLRKRSWRTILLRRRRRSDTPVGRSLYYNPRAKKKNARRNRFAARSVFSFLIRALHSRPRVTLKRRRRSGVRETRRAIAGESSTRLRCCGEPARRRENSPTAMPRRW